MKAPVVRAGLILCAAAGPAAPLHAQELGAFEAHGEVGDVRHKGSVRFEPSRREYRITGGGENMWGSRDAFHFVWRRSWGDLSLTADVAFPEKTGDAHRKAGWMVRQGLEADAPYADAVVHGDGLVSLQYRLVKGGPTLEVQSPVNAPVTIRLERTADLFTLSVARIGKPFQPVGSVIVRLQDPVYAGLAVCSHDTAALATALVSGAELRNLGAVAAVERVVESHLEVVSIETGERQVVHSTVDHIEAPNWSRDGRSFVFNSGGRLYALPREGGRPRLVATGTASQLNNDHGFSPDGQQLAISHSPAEDSLIYVLPAGGGEPRLVTALGPSYWHGWSPDGRTLVYCASRNDEYDVYAIPANAERSTQEVRLTTAPGLDDGPDYAPDGSIYFNSERTGVMRVWSMKADGSEQRQVTFDEDYADWFPHPSPDGKWLVFLSYDKSVTGHPANREVVLRLMPLGGGETRVLARLFGGQGTLNVPSWAPDSRSLAFVSYRLVKP